MIVRGSGNILVRAHHLGSVSPREDPGYYVKCALDLFIQYGRLLMRHQLCPLVVNSAGWVQGTGLEVLTKIIKSQSLSDIVYTSTRGPQDVVDMLVEAAQPSQARMHFLDSQESPFTTRTATDLRQMQTMSYFHLDEPEADNLRWDATPIMERAPLSVHWAGDNQALFAVVELIDHVDPEYLFHVLDGCIVGLVVLEDDTALFGHAAIRTNQSGLALAESQAAEGPQAPQADLFATTRSGSSSDSDSGPESVNSSRSSIQWNEKPRAEHTKTSTRLPFSGEYLAYPLILRNSMDIPYVAPGESAAVLLDPSRSYSLGQAFVRGIDLEAKCFQLLTPVPSEVLKAFHDQGRKIVLVRGRLETPTWAYREEWERGAALRQKLRKEYPDDADILEAEERRIWAEKTPYVSIPNQTGAKSASARVWTGPRGSDIQDLDHDPDE